MKMNFLGLHTYPFSATDAGHSTGHNEPTVFVGTADDLEADGSVKVASAYPTSYANTMRGEWGYAPMATSNCKCSRSLCVFFPKPQRRGCCG